MTAGLHAGVAACEWHLHAWDVARAIGLVYRVSDPATLYAAVSDCTATAEGVRAADWRRRSSPSGAGSDRGRRFFGARAERREPTTDRQRQPTRRSSCDRQRSVREPSKLHPGSAAQPHPMAWPWHAGQRSIQQPGWCTPPSGVPQSWHSSGS